jgi:hypothetical protein
VICILSALPISASALQSSISALERDIAALESQSSGLEPWLGRFTLLVAIGVALEIFVVIHDHKKEVNEWRVSELISEPPSLTRLGIEIASIILVIAGVMGEFGVGLKISSINGQLRAKAADLRSKGDQLLRLATQEAAEADVRAAKNEKEAGQLRKDAEAERLKRIALEASVGWRRLSEQQQNEIGFDIGLRFRNASISVWYLHGDIEGARFAADISRGPKKGKVARLAAH